MDRLRYWFGYWLYGPRLLGLIAVAIVAAFFVLGPGLLKNIAFWIGVVAVAALAVALALWIARRARARRSSEQLGDVLAGPAIGVSGTESDADLAALRERMREAVKSIRTSRLGQTRGRQALYELPWYMIIGNPAAGKSTAIVNSGLTFPFAGEHGKIVQGIGGTRNCDWYFTSEGIILDTAGRYSVHDDNRNEWLSFLELLRKYRPRAPINGIIIAASVAELTGNRPEFAIDLAKKLRQRVQELTEWLEVIAPVYVVFTKADLIAGFQDFFGTLDEHEREKAWGATFPFKPDGSVDVVERFDRYFDELGEGLREMTLAQMSLNRGSAVGPGMLTLPLEFNGIKGALRNFVATLFEDNPYQYKPVFRGFYFTSALQEAESVHRASDGIAHRFALASSEATSTPSQEMASNGYFLRDLFRKVIFADRRLVRQHSNRERQRVRYAVLAGAALALGLVLAGWAWSYTNNRQLVSNAQADLATVVAMQNGRLDLEPRLDALRVLQDRLQQLQAYRHDHPLLLGLGLYQGNAIEARIRAEYFHGMQQVMVAPVTQSLEGYLNQVVVDRSRLSVPQAGSVANPAGAQVAVDYEPPSPVNSQDAYNALRAYLMLGHPDKVEPVQLSDQLTRFWRAWLSANQGTMPREKLIASAQSLMAFYVAQYRQPGWPVADDKASLVDDVRAALRGVMSGMPAIDRVYAQLQARASTRFPTVTVASIFGDGGDPHAVLAGSHAVPGVFTRAAWDGYVRAAIKDAANKELNTSDWVLGTAQVTDLTVAGSPEQVQKQLQALYDQDYIAHWRKFITGVSVRDFDGFAGAVTAMGSLGDPQNSPLRKLLEAVYQETSWDNPSLVDQGLKQATGGFIEWFKRVILRHNRTGVNIDPDNMHAPASSAPLKTGPVGEAFAGVARVVITRGNAPAPLQAYLDMLGKLRTRLNAIKNQGDPGPGARKLMAQTLEGGDSELATGLQMVDQQMLDGLDDVQRNALRPLLLRPLMQTFQALIAPAETDIDRTWVAQVYQPFEKSLAGKYPFDSHGQVQATDSEIAQIFGPGGEISRFASGALGPLVIQRGDTLVPQQWASMGIVLSPALMAGFSRWVAPLGQAAGGGGAQTVFQVFPEPGQGDISEYTININGQVLRYQNTPPAWTSFVWSASQDAPVARITALSYDGRSVELENFTGPGALAQLFKAASGGQDKDSGVYSLRWSRDGKSVAVRLKIVSSPQVNADGSQKQGLLGVALPLSVVGAAAPDPGPTTHGEAK